MEQIKLHYFDVKCISRLVVGDKNLDISRAKRESWFLNQTKVKQSIFNRIVGFIAEIEG